MKKITACRSFLVAFVLLLANKSAMATTLTDVNPLDKSLEYMRYIFGSIVDIIIGGTGPSSPDSMIGALSEVLNTGMLIFTGLVIGYVFLTGVMNSAHEGNPLGKVYNTMWIPLRMVFALSLVLPFSGGYSSMQIGVIYFAGQGIGLANSTWNRALDHISSTGSLYPAKLGVDFDEIATNTLKNRVCMHGINSVDRPKNIVDKPINIRGDILEVGQMYTSFYTPATIGAAYSNAMLTSFAGGIPTYYGINPCGSLKLSFAAIDEALGFATITMAFYDEIIVLTDTLNTDMNTLAIQIVAHHVDRLNYPTPPDKTLFNDAVTKFKHSYTSAVNALRAGIATARTDNYAQSNISGSKLGARDAGWLSAGAWYWEMQETNQTTHEMIVLTPTFGYHNKQAMGHHAYDKIMKSMDKYLENKITLGKDGYPTTKLESGDSEFSLWYINNVLADIKQAMNIVLKNPDPVSGVADLGRYIIGALETAYLLTRTIEIATQTADAAPTAAGSWFAVAVKVVAQPFMQIAGDVVRSVLAAIFLLGPVACMMAFYLPSIPLILWVMGVCGWYILLIEAVIAAPIWAASHAMPEGGGLVGQRAMAGYMVILSLFLRPTLMLFGFFTSMVLMIVMGKVVSLLFIPAMASMTAGYLSGVVTLFSMLIIFINLLIQIAHRSYGLIHEVPDKVLRYIGGGSENLGEAASEQQGRSMFVAGVAGGKQASEKPKGGNQQKPPPEDPNKTKGGEEKTPPSNKHTTS